MSDMQKNGVQLEDFVIATDDAEGFGLRGGAPFEPEVLHALRQYIQPGSVVLDIGANVGYFTAHISKLVGSAGRVHAFEPEPRNFSLLSSNVAANHLQNVVLHPMALGDREDTGVLHLSDFSGGMHRLTLRIAAAMRRSMCRFAVWIRCSVLGKSLSSRSM